MGSSNLTSWVIKKKGKEKEGRKKEGREERTIKKRGHEVEMGKGTESEGSRFGRS